MSDEAVTAFARDLAAEVDESVRSDEGSVYNEEEFTRMRAEQAAGEKKGRKRKAATQDGA